MRVEAYWNTHKRCVSYRPIGGRVGHAQVIVLDDVTFTVQPAGRDRARETGRKNVHAFARGELIYSAHTNSDVGDYNVINMVDQGYRRARYSPWDDYATFVIDGTGEPVLRARQAVLVAGRVFLSGEHHLT